MKTPELTSKEINEACWAFVEAMPHQLPGPIFNDLKPAIVAAVSRYQEATAPEANQKCTCPSGDGSLRWPCPAHPPTPDLGLPTEGSAREFVEWMKSQPEDREPTTIDGALAEFEAKRNQTPALSDAQPTS